MICDIDITMLYSYHHQQQQNYGLMTSLINANS